MITQQHKYTRPNEDAAAELYELVNDPAEKNDIAKQEPEVCSSMEARYQAWFADVTMEHGQTQFAPPRIHVGTSHEPETMLSRQDWRCHGEEGWRDQHYGHWEIQTEAGEYGVSVQLPPADESRTVVLEYKDWTAKTTVAAGENKAALRSERIPGGKGRFEAWIDAGGTKRSVNFVTLSRVTN